MRSTLVHRRSDRFPYADTCEHVLVYDRRGFVMGYFVGASGVVVMAIADKKGPSGQPLTVDGVDDRAYRKHIYMKQQIETSKCTHII